MFCGVDLWCIARWFLTGPSQTGTLPSVYDISKHGLHWIGLFYSLPGKTAYQGFDSLDLGQACMQKFKTCQNIIIRKCFFSSINLYFIGAQCQDLEIQDLEIQAVFALPS